MTSSYLKTSVFACPHEYDESPFSKLSTLESVLENAGYVWMVAVFGEKSVRFRKYPATCGRGLGRYYLGYLLERFNLPQLNHYTYYSILRRIDWGIACAPMNTRAFEQAFPYKEQKNCDVSASQESLSVCFKNTRRLVLKKTVFLRGRVR